MNCTTNTANDIAQCAGSVHVGSITGAEEDTAWTLRVLNTGSGRIDYMQGTGSDIVVTGINFAPSTVYALSLTSGDTFVPFAGEDDPGTIEVDAIFVKVVKGFMDGEIYTPDEQWLVLPQ